MKQEIINRIIEFYEIEQERYEQEGEACVHDMMYDDLRNGDLDTILNLIEYIIKYYE